MQEVQNKATDRNQLPEYEEKFANLRQQIIEEERNADPITRQYQEMADFIESLADIGSAEFRFRSNLISYWTIVIILSNLIHITVTLQQISILNPEIQSGIQQIGVATLLSWFSLNSYLIYSKDYAILANSIILSSVHVMNGLVGIAPVFLGVSALCVPYLGSCFRFKDWAAANFTCFYNIFGDTVFDTWTGARQANFLFANAWAYLWIFFGTNVVINITLAQVESGYLR